MRHRCFTHCNTSDPQNNFKSLIFVQIFRGEDRDRETKFF